MASFDYVKAEVEAFGALIGIAGVELDQEGRAALDVGAYEVSLLYEERPVELLWLFADLGEVPEDDKAPEFLLRLNFFSWLGDTLTIALDDDDKTVIGFTAIPSALLTSEVLHDAFIRFSRAALVIGDKLAARDYDAFDEIAVSVEATDTSHSASFV